MPIRHSHAVSGRKMPKKSPVTTQNTSQTQKTCCVRSKIQQNPPDHNTKSLKLHTFMSYPVGKCLKRARSQHEQKLEALKYHSLSSVLPKSLLKGTIYLFTTSPLNRTFYTFCHPERSEGSPYAVLSVVSGQKRCQKSPVSTWKHEKRIAHCNCYIIYRFFASLRMTKSRCFDFNRHDRIKMSRLCSE